MQGRVCQQVSKGLLLPDADVSCECSGVHIIVAGLLSAAEVEYHLFDICSMILWIRRKNSSLFLHSQS